MTKLRSINCFFASHLPLLLYPATTSSPMNTTEKETMVAAAIPNGAKLNPYDSGLKMARAIRDGTVTSRQLVEMYIDRIERLDTEKINAVVVRDFDGARSRADEADEKLRLWKKDGGITGIGIFHGVP